MKVSALVAQLQQLDQDHEVIVEKERNSNTFEPLASVEQVRFQKESSILLTKPQAPGEEKELEAPKKPAHDASPEVQAAYRQEHQAYEEKQRRGQQGQGAVLLRAHQS